MTTVGAPGQGAPQATGAAPTHALAKDPSLANRRKFDDEPAFGAMLAGLTETSEPAEAGAKAGPTGPAFAASPPANDAAPASVLAPAPAAIHGLDYDAPEPTVGESGPAPAPIHADAAAPPIEERQSRGGAPAGAGLRSVSSTLRARSGAALDGGAEANVARSENAMRRAASSSSSSSDVDLSSATNLDPRAGQPKAHAAADPTSAPVLTQAPPTPAPAAQASLAPSTTSRRPTEPGDIPARAAAKASAGESAAQVANAPLHSAPAAGEGANSAASTREQPHPQTGQPAPADVALSARPLEASARTIPIDALASAPSDSRRDALSPPTGGETWRRGASAYGPPPDQAPPIDRAPGTARTRPEAPSTGVAASIPPRSGNGANPTPQAGEAWRKYSAARSLPPGLAIAIDRGVERIAALGAGSSVAATPDAKADLRASPPTQTDVESSPRIVGATAHAGATDPPESAAPAIATPSRRDADWPPKAGEAWRAISTARSLPPDLAVALDRGARAADPQGGRSALAAAPAASPVLNPLSAPPPGLASPGPLRASDGGPRTRAPAAPLGRAATAAGTVSGVAPDEAGPTTPALVVAPSIEMSVAPVAPATAHAAAAPDLVSPNKREPEARGGARLGEIAKPEDSAQPGVQDSPANAQGDAAGARQPASAGVEPKSAAPTATGEAHAAAAQTPNATPAIPFAKIPDFIASAAADWRRQSGAAVLPAEPRASAAAANAPPVKELEVQLNPASLGAMTIQMRLSNGNLSVVVKAANSDTRKLIENERGAISDKLKSLAFTVESVAIRPMDTAGSEPGKGAPQAGAQGRGDAPRDRFEQTAGGSRHEGRSFQGDGESRKAPAPNRVAPSERGRDRDLGYRFV